MILITGAKGQLGQELLERFQRAGTEARGASADEWDIRDPQAGAKMFQSTRPKFLINCAAYTAVDKAEEDEDRAREINATAVDVLGDLCQRNNTFFLHVSTDFVFGGENTSSEPVHPWLPEDRIAPRGVYAQTKAEGEQFVLKRFGGAPSSIRGASILRTSWVYSVHGRNFPMAILNKARAIVADSSQGPLRVVEDQIGRPTWAGRIADFIRAYIERISKDAAGPSELPGEILHLCNSGVASWYDFARAVLEEARASGLLAADVPIVPVPSSAYPTPAPRPAYSVMNLEATRAFYEIPHWRHDLQVYMNQLREKS